VAPSNTRRASPSKSIDIFVKCWLQGQLIVAKWFAYNLRFPGQYYDAETGLNQNWNRDYDPMAAGYVESSQIQ
jgi:RHS repeat-associated protein